MNVDKKDINNLVDLDNHDMKLKARKMIEIIFILGIQQKSDTKF